MALNLKIENSIHVSGKVLYIRDVTGIYSSPVNEGGWGNPNPERNSVALMGIIEKYHTNGESTLLSAISPQIDYDPNYANDYQSEFTFQVSTDGGHAHYMLVIGVSDDGNTFLDGSNILPGNYFYLTTDEFLYQKQEDNSNRLVENYKELIDDTNGNRPEQVKVKQFWTPLLSTKQAELYNEYRIARLNCDNEIAELDKVVELDLNLTHAAGLFYRGLYMDAESVIETQLDLFDLNT